MVKTTGRIMVIYVASISVENKYIVYKTVMQEFNSNWHLQKLDINGYDA